MGRSAFPTEERVNVHNLEKLVTLRNTDYVSVKRQRHTHTRSQEKLKGVEENRR